MGLHSAANRDLGNGLYWLGSCNAHKMDGKMIHQHVSTFLVLGDEKAILVDTGHPKAWSDVEPYLDEVLGDRQIDYLFPTHSEYPHAGNLGRLLKKYPKAQAYGDLRDFHLFHPTEAERLNIVQPGYELDLGGGRTFRFLEGILRDMPTTMWGWDSGTGTLFVSDGFCFTHEHEAGQCDLLASEMPSVPEPEQTKTINERALWWARYVDAKPFFARCAQQRAENPTRMIAPGHGNVIDQPDVIVPILESYYN